MLRTKQLSRTEQNGRIAGAAGQSGLVRAVGYSKGSEKEKSVLQIRSSDTFTPIKFEYTSVVPWWITSQNSEKSCATFRCCTLLSQIIKAGEVAHLNSPRMFRLWQVTTVSTTAIGIPEPAAGT